MPIEYIIIKVGDNRYLKRANYTERVGRKVTSPLQNVRTVELPGIHFIIELKLGLFLLYSEQALLIFITIKLSRF